MTGPALIGPGLLGPGLLALALVVVAVVTVLCVVRARRLDRLHRRTDAARAGLADALDGRATVALRVADAVADRGAEAGAHRAAAPVAAVPAAALPRHGHMTLPARPEARPASLSRIERGSKRPRTSDALALRAASEALALRTAARDALTACRAGARAPGAGFELCEVAENALTRRLALVDRAVLPAELAGELLDAEQLVLLARRVHNDAVRDTLDLRSRRLVRLLRLAGTAPEPAYFEIADPPRRDVRAPAPNAADGRRDAVPGAGVAR